MNPRLEMVTPILFPYKMHITLLFQMQCQRLRLFHSNFILLLPSHWTFLETIATNHSRTTTVIVSLCSQLLWRRSNRKIRQAPGVPNSSCLTRRHLMYTVPLIISNLPPSLASQINVKPIGGGVRSKLRSSLKSVKDRFTSSSALQSCDVSSNLHVQQQEGREKTHFLSFVALFIGLDCLVWLANVSWLQWGQV